MCSRVCRLLNAITISLYTSLLYTNCFCCLRRLYHHYSVQGTKHYYSQLIIARFMFQPYPQSGLTLQNTYINHRNCIHVQTFNLRGGLVADAVVVSLSKKEQVYVNLIHWKTLQRNLQYCLILNHKKLLYVIFSHLPKIPSQQK